MRSKRTERQAKERNKKEEVGKKTRTHLIDAKNVGRHHHYDHTGWAKGRTRERVYFYIYCNFSFDVFFSAERVWITLKNELSVKNTLPPFVCPRELSPLCIQPFSMQNIKRDRAKQANTEKNTKQMKSASNERIKPTFTTLKPSTVSLLMSTIAKVKSTLSLSISPDVRTLFCVWMQWIADKLFDWKTVEPNENWIAWKAIKQHCHRAFQSHPESKTSVIKWSDAFRNGILIQVLLFVLNFNCSTQHFLDVGTSNWIQSKIISFYFGKN